MNSRQFKKTISMVMVIAVIMSVCAVCFGTFSNAASATPGETYTFGFDDVAPFEFKWSNTGVLSTGTNAASAYINASFYGPVSQFTTTNTPDPGVVKGCYQFVDTTINLGSDDGKVVFEAGKIYQITLNFTRYYSSNGAIVALGAMDSTGKVFPLEPHRTPEEMSANPSGAFSTDNDTWIRFGARSGTLSATPHIFKATVDGSALNRYTNQAYAGCSLVLLNSHGGYIKIGLDEMTIAVSKGETNAAGTYNFGFEDAPEKIEFKQSKKGTLGVTNTPTYLNAAYYGPVSGLHVDNNQANVCYQFVDTSINLGSADGKVVFKAGKTYQITLNITRVNSANNSLVALGAMDSQGNVFPLEPLKTPEVMAANPSGACSQNSDSWLQLGSCSTANGGQKFVLKATVDGDAINKYNNGVYAGSSLVLLNGGAADHAYVTVSLDDMTIIVTDNINEGASASIRPEIKEGDTEKFGDGFVYQGYQSAAIRFNYTIADTKIENATDLGFVILADNPSVDEGDDWYGNASVNVSTFGKKYADGDLSDTYMVAITNLTKEAETERSLRDIGFFVAFYYVVDDVTTYVDLFEGSVSYGTVYGAYETADDQGNFDENVYGALEWYAYEY